jgi:D-3-phosphoglycerate dehydrogenase
MEARAAIGREVASTLLRFVNNGNTQLAINFPQLEPPGPTGRHRILNIHRNVPGVPSQLNTIISDLQANVDSQMLATDPYVGHLIMDIDRGVYAEVGRRIDGQRCSLQSALRRIDQDEQRGALQ